MAVAGELLCAFGIFEGFAEGGLGDIEVTGVEVSLAVPTVVSNGWCDSPLDIVELFVCPFVRAEDC